MARGGGRRRGEVAHQALDLPLARSMHTGTGTHPSPREPRPVGPCMSRLKSHLPAFRASAYRTTPLICVRWPMLAGGSGLCQGQTSAPPSTPAPHARNSSMEALPVPPRSPPKNGTRCAVDCAGGAPHRARVVKRVAWYGRLRSPPHGAGRVRLGRREPGSRRRTPRIGGCRGTPRPPQQPPVWRARLWGLAEEEPPARGVGVAGRFATLPA